MAGQTTVIPRPDILETPDDTASEWIVVVFDNDYNTFDQVIGILQEATGCSLEEARMETWEIHHLGRSVVHHADRTECERVAAIIRRIGIDVAVKKL